MNRPVVRLLAAAAVAVPILAACSGDDDGGADRQEVLTALVDEVYVPGYERVAAAAAGLAEMSASLCDALEDPEALSTAQDGWSELRTAWLLTRAFRFGPAIDQRAMSDIDFAVDTEKVDDLLAGDEPVDEDAVASLGADVRGINAIEHVLFAETPLDERSCEYVESASVALRARADLVLAAWTTADGDEPSFADQLRSPGDGGMYTDVAEAYGDVVNYMMFTLNDIIDLRLGKASGDMSGTPEPEEADPGRAQRGRDDIADLLSSVAAVYGVGADEDQLRLRDAVAEMSDETADALDDEIVAAQAAVDEIPTPLADATDPEPAHAAYEAASTVRVTMQAEVASLLGITLTFGDADGDS